MNTSKFSPSLLQALELAQNKVLIESKSEISCAHLLSALLEQKNKSFTDYIKSFGLQSARIDALLSAATNIAKSTPTTSSNTLTISRNLAKTFALMDSLATKLQSDVIRSEFFISCLLQTDDECKALLESFSINHAKASSRLSSLAPQTTTGDSEDEQKSIDAYTIDLTTDPSTLDRASSYWGKSTQLTQMMQSLVRMNKNNPILVAPAGVGKTALVEMLAYKINQSLVPQDLQGYKILSLDLAGMLAGTKFRGEFEERLKSLIKECSQKDKKIILFIDEIHTLVGAGQTEGAMDASNILKPALARGELKCIGATTPKEYTKYIAKDAALSRRFQKITLTPPSKEETLCILRELKPKLESVHSITIQDKALQAAVDLSDRYLPHTFFPDKAIDLIDEACARVKISQSTPPLEALKKLEQVQIMQKLSPTAREQEKISCLNTQAQSLMQVYEKQKLSSVTLDELQEKKALLEKEVLDLTKQGKWDEVAKIEYTRLNSIKELIEKKLTSPSSSNLPKLESEEPVLYHTNVSEDVVALILKENTGIQTISQNGDRKKEFARLGALKDTLSASIIAQPAAIEAVVKVIKRSATAISNPSRPHGSFLFLGPTGTGKTQLAKTLAKELFSDESSFVRIDMSELMEEHSVSKLIGSPAGYVGWDTTPALVQAVQTRPYSIVLFDEIEKAHPKVLNILLQILEDGHLTDSQGQQINFKNTIIIMTSNTASPAVLEAYGHKSSKIGFNPDTTSSLTPKELEKVVLNSLLKTMPPELINRIDEIVTFCPLDDKAMKSIAIIELDKVSRRLKSQDYQVCFDQSVSDLLSTQGFDIKFGARPLRRYIEQNVESFISEQIIDFKLVPNTHYTITHSSAGLELLTTTAPAEA